MMPTSKILNNFYDKKRKIEYYRIARLIEKENNENPMRPPKGLVGDKPDHSVAFEKDVQKYTV